jgi:hypothetical protein
MKRLLSALGHAADAVTAGAYPYVYGGGHEQAGTASIGIKGPGHNGRRLGFAARARSPRSSPAPACGPRAAESRPTTG